MSRTYDLAFLHRNAAALSNIGSSANTDVESIMATLDTYLSGFIADDDYSDRLTTVNNALLNVDSPISQITNSDFTFKGVKTLPDGIKFTKEALKYYDEGTWTPSDASGDFPPLVSSSLARYVKIGNVVVFNLAVTYASNSSSTNAKISGPPYTVVGANRTCHVWTTSTVFGAYGELVANGARTDIQFWRRIPLDLPNHERVTNQDLSIKTVRCHGMFFV